MRQDEYVGRYLTPFFPIKTFIQHRSVRAFDEFEGLIKNVVSRHSLEELQTCLEELEKSVKDVR